MDFKEFIVLRTHGFKRINKCTQVVFGTAARWDEILILLKVTAILGCQLTRPDASAQGRMKWLK